MLVGICCRAPYAGNIGFDDGTPCLCWAPFSSLNVACGILRSDSLSLLGVTINLKTIYTCEGLVAPIGQDLNDDSIKVNVVVRTNSKILIYTQSQGFMDARK